MAPTDGAGPSGSSGGSRRGGRGRGADGQAGRAAGGPRPVGRAGRGRDQGQGGSQGVGPDRAARAQLPAGPAVPLDVTGRELDKDVRRELSSLRRETGDLVARHLVMAARLIDENPNLAYEHSAAARRLAPRIGVVREALGLASYHAGRHAEALAELRAARRITGSNEQWPVMADCERALGRPERALQMATAPEVATLDAAGRAEMRIVAAGARGDLGQLEAAVVTLQVPELTARTKEPWLARLRYAYSEALAATSREDEARLWLARAAEADEYGVTDAAERLAELDGIVFTDAVEDAGEAAQGPADQGPADGER
jgi:tetratricopeptide (TPR) repeat protein